MNSPASRPTPRRKRLATRVTAMLAAAASLVGVLLLVLPADADVDNSDLVDSLATLLPRAASSIDWLPDGRAVSISKDGELGLVDPTLGTSSVLLTVADLNTTGERGALDVAVDPNFANNGHVYVYATRGATAQLEIVRYTMVASTINPATLAVIWQNPSAPHSTFGEYHAGGSLNFGPDSKMYLTVGDGFLTTNSQDLTNAYGKVLRLNPDGTIPGDNPNLGATAMPGIWAYGLRNPFRTSFDPTTGNYWIGDVGGNIQSTAYEELNLGQAGANYGWPTCEGPLTGNKGAACPNGVTGPVFHYEHIGGQASGTGNSAITGGEIFRSSQLGEDLDGAYIYADYARLEIRYLEMSGTSVTGDGTLLDVTAPGQYSGPTWIGASPSGELYYVVFNWTGPSELRRVTSAAVGEVPPTISAAQGTPETGEAPLDVAFSVNASHIADLALTYWWDFGDGATSTQQSPTHTYAALGVYEARVTVTASNALTATSSPIRVEVGVAPTVTINSPTDRSFFLAGDTLTLSGSATDDVDQPGDLTYTWDVGLRHDNHVHPVIGGVEATDTTLAIATSGHDYAGETFYEIKLSVTDSDGLTGSATVTALPTEHDLTVEATLPAVPVDIGGITLLTPTTVEVLERFELPVELPSMVCSSGTEWELSATSGATITDGVLTMPDSGVSIEGTYVDLQRSCRASLPVAGDLVPLAAGPNAYTTGYDDLATLSAAAEKLGMGEAEFQRTGVHVIRFLNALGNVTDPPDLTGQFPTAGAAEFTSVWPADELANLEWVTEGYAITPEEAQAFGATLLVFLTALAG